MEAQEPIQIVTVKEIGEEAVAQEIKRIKADYWSGVKLTEQGIFGSIQMHNGKRVKALWIAFFLSKEKLILTIIKDENNIMKKIKEKVQHTKLEEGVSLIFDNMLEIGQHIAEEMENYLINMEREIVTGKIERKRNQAIFECKRTLTLWKRDYEQLFNTVEGINSMSQSMTEKCACYFQIYETKIRRMTEQIQFLHEELLHVREALDAAISYEQNRIMKVFTAVTTIFMPLTLVAGWYGMNFRNMPELEWRYGYLFAAVLSIAVIIICIIFFKKKKLL